MSNAPFWAVLDKFGHVQLAGLVSEEQRFGGPIGRIDVPLPDGTLQTQYFTSGAVYGLTPCSEEHARELMRRKLARPVYALPAPAAEDSDFDDLDFDDDDPSEEEEEEPAGEVFTGSAAQAATLEATLNRHPAKLAELYWDDAGGKTHEGQEGAGAAWKEAQDGLYEGEFFSDGPAPACGKPVRVRLGDWLWKGRVVRVEPLPSSTLWRIAVKAEGKADEIPF